jgi:hypothetical protein
MRRRLITTRTVAGLRDHGVEMVQVTGQGPLSDDGHGNPGGCRVRGLSVP